MRCAAAALLTFGLATTSAARAQVPTYSYADEPRVVVDPDERISGGAQVGAAFESAPGNPQLERLFVFFERSPILPLNVRLTSVDGRFLAEFPEGNWRPNESSSSSGCATRWQTSQCKAGGDRLCGWVELQLGDKVRSHLATRNQDEVAPLVVDGSGIAYPARWGACGEPESRQTLHQCRRRASVLRHGGWHPRLCSRIGDVGLQIRPDLQGADRPGDEGSDLRPAQARCGFQ